MVTRRTTRRHFLLRPDREGVTQQIYWYTTAVLAKKFGIQIHAVQMLSTHLHEVLTDTRGMLPAFLRERNRALANALKCHLGWTEEVFQRAPANCVELFGVDAILRQIGYTVANCVEAGLVNGPEEWPGVGVVANDIGVRVVRAMRPQVYFDPKNPVWPSEAELRITMPDALSAACGEQDAKRRVMTAIARAVEAARERARRAGRVVSSVSDILKVAFTRRSRSFETFGAREPTFAAAGNPQQAAEALSTRQAFLTAYRKAREAVKAGDLFARFPDGTWRWKNELVPKFREFLFSVQNLSRPPILRHLEPLWLGGHKMIAT